MTNPLLRELLPAEKMVLTIAINMIERGDEVPPNMTAVLVWALQRICSESTPVASCDWCGGIHAVENCPSGPERHPVTGE
jgi:hypothetical protein